MKAVLRAGVVALVGLTGSAVSASSRSTTATSGPSSKSAVWDATTNRASRFPWRTPRRPTSDIGISRGWSRGAGCRLGSPRRDIRSMWMTCPSTTPLWTGSGLGPTPASPRANREGLRRGRPCPHPCSRRTWPWRSCRASRTCLTRVAPTTTGASWWTGPGTLPAMSRDSVRCRGTRRWPPHGGVRRYARGARPIP